MSKVILNTLGEPLKDIVLNGKGEPMILNPLEQRIANYLQRQMNEKFGNALGYEVNITTLTTVIKRVTEQKFFEVAPADYLPVRVGEGAWSTNLVTYRSFNLADDFATGVISLGGNNARLATGDAGVDSLTINVKNWGKSIGWSIFDLEFAAKSGNWDMVVAKEKARKKNWDLGIQKVAFLGLAGDSTVLGLLNQSGVTINTTRITSSITSTAATPSNLSTLIAGLLTDYRANCSQSAWPTHFIIPESDFLGLATPSSATYPIKSILQLMQETFQTMTHNPNFKILPLAYGDKANNAGIINGTTGKQCYCLLNYDEESIRMDIPVDYTNTLANSIDNFSFQNVGYGQFTGVLAYRPAEVLYYQY
jgi:Uncharacterized protein conserved in bacteria (DUF2184)